MINGCSVNLFSTKERDARNAFVEPNLVIPPNLDASIIKKLPFANNDEYASLIAFQLLFDLNKNTYQKQNNNLGTTPDDKVFLNKSNAIKGFPDIKNNLNKQYLGVVTKNSTFIDKLLNGKLNDSLEVPTNDYKNVSKKS